MLYSHDPHPEHSRRHPIVRAPARTRAEHTARGVVPPAARMHR